MTPDLRRITDAAWHLLPAECNRILQLGATDRARNKQEIFAGSDASVKAMPSSLSSMTAVKPGRVGPPPRSLCRGLSAMPANWDRTR